MTVKFTLIWIHTSRTKQHSMPQKLKVPILKMSQLFRTKEKKTRMSQLFRTKVKKTRMSQLFRTKVKKTRMNQLFRTKVKRTRMSQLFRTKVKKTNILFSNQQPCLTHYLCRNINNRCSSITRNIYYMQYKFL